MQHTLTLPSGTGSGTAGRTHTRTHTRTETRTVSRGPTHDEWVHLNFPSVDQGWAYAWASGRAALAAWRGGHRLHSQAPRHYSATVQVSPRLARRWRALFDVPARATKLVPLPTHQSVATLMVARLFADLGVNPRQRLQVQHRTSHHADLPSCTCLLDLALQCHVKRILRLAEDRVLVEVQTQVRDAQGQLLCQVDDGYVVAGLPPADLAGLPSDCNLLRELLGLRRRLPRLSTSEGDALVSEMPVDAAMGRAYGWLSGDCGLAYSGRLGAWLSGHTRPLLQGLALRNLVLRHLVELGASVQRLRLTLAAPVALGQSLLLVLSGDEFEVHDAQGRLVAFGSQAAA